MDLTQYGGSDLETSALERALQRKKERERDKDKKPRDKTLQLLARARSMSDEAAAAAAAAPRKASQLPRLGVLPPTSENAANLNLNLFDAHKQQPQGQGQGQGQGQALGQNGMKENELSEGKEVASGDEGVPVQHVKFQHSVTVAEVTVPSTLSKKTSTTTTKAEVSPPLGIITDSNQDGGESRITQNKFQHSPNSPEHDQLSPSMHRGTSPGGFSYVTRTNTKGEPLLEHDDVSRHILVCQIVFISMS
jgi:hypothetical protein